MSLELAMITGLGITSFMTVKLLQKFRESNTMVEEAVNTLSIFFIIGLEYAAYGLADSNGLTNSKDAYIIALLITVLIFMSMLVRLVIRYWNQTKEDNEFGYFQNGGNR